MKMFTQMTKGRDYFNAPCGDSGLKTAISYCIENLTKEEAVNRILKYIEDSLELKEKEIELKKHLSQKDDVPCLLSFDYLKDNIRAIYGSSFNSNICKNIIYVDPLELKEGEKEMIDIFYNNNSLTFDFIFKTKDYKSNGLQ